MESEKQNQRQKVWFLCWAMLHPRKENVPHEIIVKWGFVHIHLLYFPRGLKQESGIALAGAEWSSLAAFPEKKIQRSREEFDVAGADWLFNCSAGPGKKWIPGFQGTEGLCKIAGNCSH